jgi:hypothetical protein
VLKHLCRGHSHTQKYGKNANEEEDCFFFFHSFWGYKKVNSEILSSTAVTAHSIAWSSEPLRASLVALKNMFAKK